MALSRILRHLRYINLSYARPNKRRYNIAKSWIAVKAELEAADAKATNRKR